MSLTSEFTRNNVWRGTAFFPPEFRAVCPTTGHYLHQNGFGLTETEDYAWWGTTAQFKELSRRAALLGDPLPPLNLVKRKPYYESRLDKLYNDHPTR